MERIPNIESTTTDFEKITQDKIEALLKLKISQESPRSLIERVSSGFNLLDDDISEASKDTFKRLQTLKEQEELIQQEAINASESFKERFDSLKS